MQTFKCKFERTTPSPKQRWPCLDTSVAPGKTWIGPFEGSWRDLQHLKTNPFGGNWATWFGAIWQRVTY